MIEETVIKDTSGACEIRPFRFTVVEGALTDLRRHIVATRWPAKELVIDRCQDVQRATLQALARHWTTEYDWRTCEAKLNALPQFTTEIDGVDIHFIHVRSRHEHALPLIMAHGWPGSVIEPGRGGHVAAWEEPQLFSEEVRAAFNSLR